MDRSLLQVLACPQCGGRIDSQSNARLDCTGCLLSYPVDGGVPVLLISAASRRSTQFTDPSFEKLLSEAIAAPFEGWDVSWLADRCTATTDDRPPLIEFYDGRARELLRGAGSVLDLVTGGGEHLARLCPLPPVAVATEAYAPNVSVAAHRLVQSGVYVIQTDPNTHRGDGPQAANRWPERRLPLADNGFDVVVASRSAFSPVEVTTWLVWVHSRPLQLPPKHMLRM